jgi:hypothetical protein
VCVCVCVRRLLQLHWHSKCPPEPLAAALHLPLFAWLERHKSQCRDTQAPRLYKNDGAPTAFVGWILEF